MVCLIADIPYRSASAPYIISAVRISSQHPAAVVHGCTGVPAEAALSKEIPIENTGRIPLFRDGPVLFLQSGVDGFTFHGEHAEHALVHPVERIPSDKPIQRFQPEGEFFQGEICASCSALASSACADDPVRGILRHR